MNFTKVVSLLLVLLAFTVTLASCNFGGIFGTTTPSDTTKDPEVDAPSSWDELYDITTIEEIGNILSESDVPPANKYYIQGKITQIVDLEKGTVVIEDATGSILVASLCNADGSLKYSEMEEKPTVNDEILVQSRVHNDNGTYTLTKAYIIDMKIAPDSTIADARELEVGEQVKVSGVVARFTYAFGMVPSGFYLVDGTDSIYVYGKEIAAEVAVGNKVTVLGSKTYWILEDEQNSANKFGYKGCCQLENALLLANDDAKNDPDLSWCKELTVKEIMNLPVNENITTTIFKTTALVKKVEGTGFLNYYIDDLDGKTGSYVYTQCSGSDFAWLDEFDGKICTVYLSIINAKSSSTGCIYRFLPIAVVDEGYEFDLANTPAHVLEYYGVDQFLAEYTGDPSLELVTSVSSELLGFEGATLSYSSSNTDLIYFEEVDGKVILHCAGEGKATVTVTATYNGASLSREIEISVAKPAEVPSINISTAIGTAVGETVTVKGIVGPSLVNQPGFYLIDETGVIAIRVNDESVFDGLAIGQEVIITGKRDQFNSKADEGSTAHGVTCITGATIVTNYFGTHEYSTSTFITGKTLADIAALSVQEDHSTSVYVVKATIIWNETPYYTNVKIEDNGTSLNLYCSGAGQYAFLKQFAGQEVTIEIAPCNWNGKAYWAGCVLAVITEDGKVYNQLNFTTK